jgi:hypothetical protein
MDHHKLAAELLSGPSFDVIAWDAPACSSGLLTDSDEALVLLCPVLGPSATIILHRLARYASAGPTVWEPEPFAATFGLSKVALAPKALSRLSRFGLALIDTQRIAVRTTVPRMPEHWLALLPDYLRYDLPLAA